MALIRSCVNFSNLNDFDKEHIIGLKEDFPVSRIIGESGLKVVNDV